MTVQDAALGASLPQLRRHGSATQLVVDGRPFLVVGGELHNSSASSLAYMEPIWERLVALGLNTVLAPVWWELCEPAEGEFDFTLVDGLLHAARAHGLRLILLWFGSWKNGMSSYMPGWVKRDYRRFPRLRRADGQAAEVLCTLTEANWQADARAFAALLRHLRVVDGTDHTVLMVQVENEVGVLGASRDHAEAANAALAGPVPPELLAHLQQHGADMVPELRARWEAAGGRSAGAWQEVFGDGLETDEIFMAWHYARYVDRVAAAGKAAYPLPLYVNAWLNAPVAPDAAAGGPQPGDYPSGGPLPHVLDIWRAGAPHVDLLSPDIYFGDFAQWCRLYTRQGNPLFIPEMRWDEEGARHVFFAVGEHDALGTSPFAVDSLQDPLSAPLIRNYALLRQLAPLILEHQGQGRMTGFVLDAEHPSVTRELGGYVLEIRLAQSFGYSVDRGCGLVIATAPDQFVGAGYGFRVSFRPATPGPARAGIAAVDEGTYRHGHWIPGRRWNGDETGGGEWWLMLPVDWGTSSRPNQGPGSGIARCTLYRYE
jgi:beta-galactosidase GanA